MDDGGRDAQRADDSTNGHANVTPEASTADHGAPALLALALRLATEAGTLVSAGRAAGLTNVRTKGTPTDMLTEFDQASEAHIVAGLRAARPHDGLVGEEGSSQTGTSGITWFVDPIDGTTNYVYDLPGYAVSIAAADEHGMLVGVVHNPRLGETFTAMRGLGAWLDGAPIRPSTLTDLSTALVATGFGNERERRRKQGSVAANLLPRIRDIRRLGAASVDLCHAACGRVDAYYEEGLGPWDLAAGGLVAAEAGCVCTDFYGGPITHRQMVVATPGIADALREALLSSGAPIL